MPRATGILGAAPFPDRRLFAIDTLRVPDPSRSVVASHLRLKANASTGMQFRDQSAGMTAS